MLPAGVVEASPCVQSFQGFADDGQGPSPRGLLGLGTNVEPEVSSMEAPSEGHVRRGATLWKPITGYGISACEEQQNVGQSLREVLEQDFAKMVSLH